MAQQELPKEEVNMEELLAKIDCPELERIREFFPELDFSEELKKNPHLADHLIKEIQREASKVTDPLAKENAPKLDEDFKEYFVINNLPKCAEEKIAKLKGVITKACGKQNLALQEDRIDIPINPETNQTYGVAFIKMENEENARIGAAIFDNFKLTKSNIFATCMLADYNRIIQTQEEFVIPQAVAGLRDLRAPIFDVKREQYFYTRDKNVIINKFDKTRAQNGQPDEQIVQLEGAADKPVQWSPKGTYMIVIKPEQVTFLGGESMIPIITLPQSKVENVKMSPCEQYVLTFSPKADVPFTVWNFQMVEVIRELPIGDNEDIDSYKWSFDGQYLAKKFQSELKKEGSNEVKKKEGISVYELPSMELLKNQEGQKKSITIPGIRDWAWAPQRNTLTYICRYGDDEESEEEQLDMDDEYGREEKKVQKAAVPNPRIGFMNIPSRQVVNTRDLMSKSLRFANHPNLNYVCIINSFVKKGKKLFAVELFDLTNNISIPHQQISIKREIMDMMDVFWEPNGRMLSILTLSKKESTSGINMNAMRLGVDIFQVEHDKLKGFIVNSIGSPAADRVVDFVWSPAGEVFVTLEKDGTSQYWNWYFIQEQKAALASEAPKQLLGKYTGRQEELKKVNKMQAAEALFEFKKTNRNLAPDNNNRGIWDKYGRFFVSHGVRGGSYFDKDLRSIRIYSMFGDSLQSIEKIPGMSQFSFRPRPDDLLDAKALKDLKNDFKKKYGKICREEEIQERKMIQDKIREDKKVIRDEFIYNFFLPLRRKYEENIEQYEALWPLKDDEMEPELHTFDHVYAQGDMIKQEKLVRK